MFLVSLTKILFIYFILLLGIVHIFFLKFYKQMKTYNIFLRNPPTKMPLLKLRGIFVCKTIKCIKVSFQNINSITNIKLPVN